MESYILHTGQPCPVQYWYDILVANWLKIDYASHISFRFVLIIHMGIRWYFQCEVRRSSNTTSNIVFVKDPVLVLFADKGVDTLAWVGHVKGKPVLWFSFLQWFLVVSSEWFFHKYSASGWWGGSSILL